MASKDCMITGAPVGASALDQEVSVLNTGPMTIL